MVDDRLQRYFEAVFALSPSQKRTVKKSPRWEFLQEIFNRQADLQLPGARGTLWRAYNAITTFEDYKKPEHGEQPEQRLERTWFGGGADIKLKALEKAKELARSWS